MMAQINPNTEQEITKPTLESHVSGALQDYDIFIFI